MISFDLTEEQIQIRDTARKFAMEEIAPTAIERDINSEYPADIVKKLGEIGFMGMMVPSEYGGSGLDTLSYTLVLEEICRIDASVGIIVSVHNSLVNWILEHYGNDYQKEKYLQPLASGDMLGAFCLSEPEAGSDATQLHTLAEYDNGDWILNGTKNWVSSGTHADLFVVFVQTNTAMRHKGITCYLVEKGTEGFLPGLKEDKMGMHSSDTCSIGLTNVRLPDEQIVGKLGEGFRIAMESLNGGRIGIATQAVGIAQGAFDLSLKYALERKAFGNPIIDHQLIQQKLAWMSTKIEAARLLVQKAASLKDAGQNFIMASAQAKLFASTIANEVTREAVQIHGGYGYVREYQVERMMRDAKVTEIYEGTSEIQQLVIVKEMMKKINY
jgi:alkylation response protein AidB-like acyl-CoA dehydrogenase